MNNFDLLIGDVSPTDERLIRDEIKQAIDKYASGEQPYLGGFLTAVMANDLFRAAGRADEGNKRNLAAIVYYVDKVVRSSIRGSYKAVEAWQATCDAAHR